MPKLISSVSTPPDLASEIASDRDGRDGRNRLESTEAKVKVRLISCFSSGVHDRDR